MGSIVKWVISLRLYCMVNVQFSSVTQSCPNLCDPMDCSMPGLPVHHQLPEFTQTHVHWVGDDIQPSHPLPTLSPAFNLSQYQGPFQWVSSLHQVAKALELHFQHQSFHEYSGLISLGWTGWISWLSKGHSRVFSNTTVQKHPFFGLFNMLSRLVTINVINIVSLETVWSS